MDTIESAGKHRGGIELDEVKVVVYKEMDDRSVSTETYNNLEAERKAQTDDISEENVNKTNVAIVVLSVIVTVLVVTVVAVSSSEYFGVHEGWTKWSNWNTCSVTCGVGIERRHRNCSNPVPQRFGNHCYGDAFDVRICLPGPCANGGWSEWGQWSTCSLTCGDGIKSRSRTCTRPEPSPLGKYCEGEQLEVVSCKRDGCTPTIVFKAKGVTDRSPSTGQTIVFGTTLVNEGNAYNTSTGIFIAPVNGTYSFSTQLCTYTQKLVNISIIVDGVTYAAMKVYDHNTYSCDTADTVAVLHAQSKVWVKCTGSSSGTPIHEASDFMNSFSGYLVHR